MFKTYSVAAIALGVTVYSLSAQAEDVVFATPVVSGSAGVVLSWVLTVAGSMLTIFVPLVAIWFKSYLAVQNTQARAQMINGSVERAAHLADADMTKQNLTMADVGPGSPTMKRAMNYVADSHPDAIEATPQATDEHIADAITAELSRIQVEKVGSVVPSVVLSPVSAVR